MNCDVVGVWTWVNALRNHLSADVVNVRESVQIATEDWDPVALKYALDIVLGRSIRRIIIRTLRQCDLQRDKPPGVSGMRI